MNNMDAMGDWIVLATDYADALADDVHTLLLYINDLHADMVEMAQANQKLRQNQRR